MPTSVLTRSVARNWPVFAIFALTFGLAVFCPATSNADVPAQFFSLGVNTWITDISADGSTIVGGHEGLFKWTPAGGLVNIGILPGSSNAPGEAYFSVTGVSGDGSIIIGYGRTSSSAGEHAWMWTEANQFAILPTLPGNQTYQEADAISDNGNVIGGINGNWGQLSSMILWNSSGIVTGSVPSQSNNSRITPSAFSADGSVAVGRDPVNGAFRWTKTDGLCPLGAWKASAVSADGNVIVGTISGYAGSTAYRWTANTGIQSLGFLYPSDTYSQATDVSADGSVIVGYSDSNPFIWSATDGMRDLRQLMTLNGLDTSEWASLYSNSVIRISADGKTIAGNGISPQGNEAWIAKNVVNATYSMWQSSQFTLPEQADSSISAPMADPDHDGIPNLLEFAFGLQPKATDSTGLPTTLKQQDGNLIFRYSVSTLITGVSYTVQTSSDLKNWSDLAYDPIEESRMGTTKNLKETIPPANTSVFVRLKVALIQ